MLEQTDRREVRRSVRGLDFFQGFLRSPEQVGSIIPSSRFLERRLVTAAGLAEAHQVVELGPGTGGTTRAILAALRPDARLLSLELDATFADLLQEIHDQRLLVHHGSAADLAAILAEHGLPAPDAVISGIPFSTMPRSLATAIIATIGDCLAPGGRFVAYQFRGHVGRLGAPILGRPETQMELFNIPPMRFYCWRKPAPTPD
ncbi:MAG: methyltransferase type 12 [Chromatiaceae bacterium]|nr:MAG: methyltransferase type 12 [Chromatiaceae bacterium]